jgi:uncharacterized protein (TIGR01244 family)
MNKILQLEPSFFVSGQIGPDDMEKMACLGIQTIVCNRPDEEVEEPYQSARIAQAAAMAGISFVYMPVHGFELDGPDTPALGDNLPANADGPVLLYCRSGRRSTLLWARDAATRLGIHEVSRRTAIAGIDREELSLVLDDLEQPAAA